MIGTALAAPRFIRTQYRLYLRAGVKPRHALQRALRNLFSIY